MIGVFDSGIGGLSIVKPLRKWFPMADIVYFGDTGRVPYGTKSVQTIIKYSHQDVKFLLSKGVESIIAACGTVSSNALGELQETYRPVPILGITEPAARAAVRATRNGRVGVIATSASINSGVFERIIGGLAPSVRVFSKACPLFVSLIENGYVDRGNAVTRMVAEDYLRPLRECGIDTLILGCTHYPLIKDILGDLMPGIALIDAGEATIGEFEPAEEGGSGMLQIFVSDISQEFTATAELFLECKLPQQVQRVDVDSF